MKNVAVKFFFVFFLVAFYSFSNAQNLSKEKNRKLDEISSLLDRAMIDGDYDTILKYNTDDVVIMPGFSPAIKGKTTLEKAYEKNKKDGLIYHSFSGTSEKRWACGNEIYEYGTFGMAISSKESKRPKAYYGSYFQIWQEIEDGSFKIKYTIWNLDFNPFDHD
jgi:ketosteroid isomerase-like protein